MGGSVDDLEVVSTERLEAEILAGAARSAAAMYRWLCLIAEFDRREVATSWGAASTAAWVAWRCAVGRRTARDQVSVARRLQRLPGVAAAMAAGKLSYTKVRAICRVATTENERELLELAEVMTAAQLEEVLRRFKKLNDSGDPEPEPTPADPSITSFMWDEDGRLDMRSKFSALDGATVTAWLRAEADALMREQLEGGSAEPLLQCECERSESGMQSTEPGTEKCSHASCNDGSAEPSAARVSPRAQRFSRALVRAAERRLAALTGRSADAADRYTVLVHVDLETLCGLGDSPGYIDGGPPITSEELMWLLDGQAPMQLLIKDTKGNPLFLGRATKEPNRYFRRAMRVRDHNRCRFPGCTNELRLHGHHVMWCVRDEGPTDIWNVVSLCPRHHTLIHKGHFRVEADGHGGFRFLRTSDGAVLDRSTPLPEVVRLCEEAAAVTEPQCGTGERMTRYAMGESIGALMRSA